MKWYHKKDWYLRSLQTKVRNEILWTLFSIASNIGLVWMALSVPQEKIPRIQVMVGMLPFWIILAVCMYYRFISTYESWVEYKNEATCE